MREYGCVFFMNRITIEVWEDFTFETRPQRLRRADGGSSCSAFAPSPLSCFLRSRVRKSRLLRWFPLPNPVSIDLSTRASHVPESSSALPARTALFRHVRYCCASDGGTTEGVNIPLVTASLDMQIQDRYGTRYKRHRRRQRKDTWRPHSRQAFPSFELTWRYVSPRNRGSRRNISAKMQPTLQMSIGYPYSAASMISGDLYHRVTTYSVSSAVSSSSGELTPLDSPKSHSLRSQF